MPGNRAALFFGPNLPEKRRNWWNDSDRQHWG